jgi:hypothetical protein
MQIFAVELTLIRSKFPSTAVSAVPELLATEADAVNTLPTRDSLLLAEGGQTALAEHGRGPALRAKARVGLAKSLSLEQSVIHLMELHSPVPAERSCL